MSRTRNFVATGLVTATSLAALAMPAAAVDGTQVVTFTVTGGALAVTAVAPAAPLVYDGTTKKATGSLGLVTVTDLRVPGGNWTVGVKATDFTSSVPTSATVEAAKGTMWIPGGTITETNVDASTTFVEGTPLTLSTTAQNFVTTTAGTTANVASFTPSMSVDLTGATAGTYTSTVTYTVS